MSYRIELLARAVADMASIPPDLYPVIETQFFTLAQDPLALGRRVVSPPFAPGGMMYPFDLDVGERVYHFTNFYRFAEDESTLLITGILRL